MPARLIDRLRYRLDNIFAAGYLAQLLLLALLTALVILFGMSAWTLGLFSSEAEGIRKEIDSGFWDALWWSGKHIVDPATFDMDYGAKPAVVAISIIISILGLVIFGVFIGFISSGVEARIEALNQGTSRVIESGHVLILGWGDKTTSVINLLCRLRKRVKIVILSEREVESMREEIRLGCEKSFRRRVILRSGNPTSLEELDRVAFERAFSIIVLSGGARDDAEHDPDIGTIKTLMLLADHGNWPTQRPKIVGEIRRRENLEVAHVAARNRIPIVCSSEIIARVLVQTSRQPGLARVYADLFSEQGSQIRIQSFPECAGRTFGEILLHFTHAVPLGVSNAHTDPDGFVTYIPTLNPQPSHVVAKGEWIILLGASEETIYQSAAADTSRISEAPRAHDRPKLERILILGWSASIYEMLREYDHYMKPGSRVEIVAGYDNETAMSMLNERLGARLSSVELSYRRGAFMRRSELRQHLSSKPDCVVILSGDSSGLSDRDAQVIKCLILLQDLQREMKQQANGGNGSSAHVVANVSSTQNRELLERLSQADIVASPEIASWLITQVALQQMLQRIYESLLDAAGDEIYLKPADLYVPLNTPCSFQSVIVRAWDCHEIAFGVRNASGELHINPEQHREFTFTAADRIIVLAEDRFREEVEQRQTATAAV